MSNNAFRVKNSLHLTPQAVEPSGLEVGDLWMDIDGNLKRWDGSASQDVGSGGVGSVDIMFAQTLEQAVIGDFTTTGTVAIVEIATNPLDILQGKKTLKITHTGGASAEQIVEVPAKFRNKNVTLSLDVNSDATSGNLSLTVTDQTNTVTLINAESIQPQEAGQTSVKRSVSFNVPSDCEELKYKFTAVSESGAISLIDNVVIELTQMSKLDTTIEIPKKEYALLKTVGTFANTANVDTLIPFSDISSASGLYSISANGTSIQYNGSYLIKIKGETGANSELVTLKIEVNGVKTSGLTQHLVDANGAGSNSHFEDSFILNLNSGDVIKAYILNPNARTNRSFELHIEQINSDQETQSVSLAQTVLVQESDSYIRVNTANGSGSTATRVRKYSGSPSSVGDAARFEQDDVNGARFVIQKSGIFTIMVTEDASNGATHGMTKNLSGVQLSTSIDALFRDPLYANNVLATQGDSGAMNGTASWTGPLVIGDIIRPQHNGQTPTDNDSYSFQLTYQGSLKQLNVSENQKIEIPTSELRMQGASSRGSTATTIVRFDSIAILRGDAFTVESDAVLGTRVTMKKKGVLNISASLRNIVGSVGLYISKNQQVLTTFPTASETLAADSTVTTSGFASASAHLMVDIGDVLRVVMSSGPSADAINSFNLFFQEQEVAVSVTNVLPQFSESDSSVRVDTANGYGSTATKIRRFSNVRDNLGSAIAYNDGSLGLPATVGDYFIINESGDYDISYTDSLSVDQSYLGLSKNASSLTTNIDAIASVERLALSRTSGTIGTCAWSGYLQAGDVIRAHTEATASSNVNHATFTISKVGKPNVTGVDVTPFAKIEYEVKQFIEQIATTSVWVSNIARFQNLNLNTNNGLIQYSDDGTNGTRFTALKPCEVSVSVNGKTTSSSAVFIRRNGTPIGTGYGNTGLESDLSVSAVVKLNAGDYIDVIRDTTASPSVRYLNIVATELRDAYQAIGGGIENTYSARINNNGTATIASQSYPFIQSVTRNSLGNVTVNFVAGFFTEAPVVTADSRAVTGSNGAEILSVTNSTAIIVTKAYTSNGVQDNDFFMSVQRQGSDYRTPSKAIGLPAQRIAYVQRTVGPATTGGTSATGGWFAVPLSTTQDPSGIGLSLASNVVTLPAGTYDINAMASLRRGDAQIRLRNTSDGTTVLVGTSAYGSDAGDAAIMPSIAQGIITINSTKTFELQYRVTTSASFGLGGMASNFAENVLTASVKFVKLEE